MPTSSPPPLPLDEHGLLPDAAWDASLPSRFYLIFAQLRDARMDAAAWTRHGEQFFDADLQMTRPKRYGAVVPPRDAAHVVLSRRSRPSAMRSLFIRRREDNDLARAERVDTGGGLLLLARRCEHVVLVGALTEEEDDEAAMFLAAVLAGVVLGPVLSADGASLLGVKSLRARLERVGA